MQNEEGLDDLLEWAASVGITDSPSLQSAAVLGCALRIATFPDEGGRGLAAIRNVKQGDLVLKVPHAALIGVHCARDDPGFGKMLIKFPHLSSVEVLTAYLLNELAKGRVSKWFPYLRHLPREHHTLAHFSTHEAQALQVEDAVWTAKQSSQNSRNKWKQALPLLAAVELPVKFTTFKAWLWASATISSRTLHVPWDEAGVLCPIGDLFNYKAPSESSFSSSEVSRLSDGGFDSSSNCYCFYARKNYAKDQQVLLCYGQYTNLELLEYYGFLLQNNPSDAVYISLPGSDEFGFPGSGDCETQKLHSGCCIEASGRPSFSLLEALRLRANLASVRKSHGYLAIQGLPISAESDVKVFQWLMKKCKAMLEELPTTITEDNSILEELDENSNSKLSVQWRVSYKKIVYSCMILSRAQVN